MTAAAVSAAPLAAPRTTLPSPIGPSGPCPDAKVDAILRGDLGPEACCSYGKCKGGVVVSVG
ncbi:uncharacterized protein F5Z01DRAFT_672613 [Emericellopsis atlantica]|uniref:Uncharacterized protein n=1 Tax=Emericellopsis atlantica TaxID=2614577 RepID=A0A9P7ZQ05_9HYPO|nr:uncharacterized protein F5Z01DRAFT_672613 [Emericellopsis atlantica]KAG9255971.1 hypothetical protein F5Z01DRAFT_672613 [Emericellopsis atlantica]